MEASENVNNFCNTFPSGSGSERQRREGACGVSLFVTKPRTRNASKVFLMPTLLLLPGVRGCAAVHACHKALKKLQQSFSEKGRRAGGRGEGGGVGKAYDAATLTGVILCLPGMIPRVFSIDTEKNESL